MAYRGRIACILILVALLCGCASSERIPVTCVETSEGLGLWKSELRDGDLVRAHLKDGSTWVGKILELDEETLTLRPLAGPGRNVLPLELRLAWEDLDRLERRSSDFSGYFIMGLPIGAVLWYYWIMMMLRYGLS